MKTTMAVVLGASLLWGCADKKEPLVPPPYQHLEGRQAAKVARAEFDEALRALAAHDEANDWTKERCETTANKFLVAAELFERVEKNRTQHLSARYDAALAYQRCGLDGDAEKLLTALVKDAPDFHRASAQLAMYRYAKSQNLDTAIGDLEESISAGKFQNVDALVNLAMLQMRRRSAAVDEQGHDDMARARLNLQRALAVDDGFMPALNQLAIFYLEQAGAGSAELQVASSAAKVSDDGHATLELAGLICTQAIRKNPDYAPIHNTAGLIATRLGDLSAAAKSFATARTLDPGFFEAHMNYAAVNLQFRGFKRAQEAYEKALKLRPKSYDAMLGLSLALRGQAGDAEEDAILARAEQLIHSAKALDERRPEAYFNQAILMQEFRSRGLPPTRARKVLLDAKSLFGAFLERAKNKPELADARSRAKERMRDIDEMIAFMP